MGQSILKTLDCARTVPRVCPTKASWVVRREFAGLLKAYGLREVTGDRFGGGWPAERFQAHGITYKPAEQSKSDLDRDFLPLLNAGRVDLLEVSRLVAQVFGLERRTARGGRDTIDHAPGARDDVTNAVAGACVGAVVDPEPGIIKWYRMEAARMRAEQEQQGVGFHGPLLGW